MVALTTTSGGVFYIGTLLLQIYYQFRYGFGIFGYNIAYIDVLVFIGGLAFLYLLAIISAMIPVCLLLRKTPIEIIKKYDI
jgi:ABC-type antimicrobial peptide transport system permease subunit